MTSNDDNKIPELLKIGKKISLLPVIHGSGQFAVTVRRWMLEHSFDCIAVPLPVSFQTAVEAAVLELPRPSIVIQPPTTRFTEEPENWQLNFTVALPLREVLHTQGWRKQVPKVPAVQDSFFLTES